MWIFFEQPYPAIRSRKILISILEQSGVFSIFDKGSSFDRLFPNQDFHSGKAWRHRAVEPDIEIHLLGHRQADALARLRRHAYADPFRLRHGALCDETSTETEGQDVRLTTSIHSSFLAFLNTSTIIWGVSLPVFVFWRLG